MARGRSVAAYFQPFPNPYVSHPDEWWQVVQLPTILCLPAPEEVGARLG